jgi:hypothetical protein
MNERIRILHSTGKAWWIAKKKHSFFTDGGGRQDLESDPVCESGRSDDLIAQQRERYKQQRQRKSRMVD